MTWKATHLGWFLFCPIYVAEWNTQAPVPIPRSNRLDWWLELNFAVCNFVIWLISFIAPDVGSYPFLFVRELDEPFEITVFDD